MDLLDLQTDFLHSLGFLFSFFWVLIHLSNDRGLFGCAKRPSLVIFWLSFSVLQLLNLLDLWFPQALPLKSLTHTFWFVLGLFQWSGLPDLRQFSGWIKKPWTLWPLIGLVALIDEATYGPLVYIVGQIFNLLWPRMQATPFCPCQRQNQNTSLLLAMTAAVSLNSNFHLFWLAVIETLILFASLYFFWNTLLKRRPTSPHARLPERILSGQYSARIFALVILLTAGLTHGISMLNQKQSENDLKQALVLISLAIPQQDIIRLSGSPFDAQSATYDKIAGLLRNIKGRLATPRRIYIVRRYLGRVVVFVDSELRWSSAYRPPGSVLDLDLAQREEAHQYLGKGVLGVRIESGIPLVTILIPYRPSDHLSLILGMDLHLSDWMLQIRINKVFPLVLSVMLLFFIGLFTWLGRGAWLDRQRLHDTESKLRIAMESTDILLWTWPDDAAAGSTNIPQSIGEWLEQIPFAYRKEAIASLKNHFRGKTSEFEAVYPIKGSDGSTRWYLDRGKILERDAQGRILRLAGARLDITQRRLITERERAAERRLFAAQKLESLGILAGGVAHDFNNILTAVLGNIEIAEMDLKENPEDVKKHLAVAARAVERAADLTKQMLAFVGKAPTQIRGILINDLIQDQVQLWRSTVRPNIDLKQELSPIPAIQIDPTHIEQILMNLILNANEAIGNKRGEIVLRSSSRYYGMDEIRRFIFFENTAEGEYVVLEVSDTGPGIPAEVLERIFDPFFSTKFTGRGMGLAAVLGLVRYYNGWIKVVTEMGRGTSFLIGMPIINRGPRE